MTRLQITKAHTGFPVASDPAITSSIAITRVEWASSIAFIVMSAITLGVMINGWWPHTVDDAFITYRYAENLASGAGPVFNPGERVEGNSCPLWMTLLALMIRAGYNPEITSKSLGILFAIGTTLLLAGVIAKETRRPLGAFAAALWFSSNLSTHVHIVSGMETMSYAFFILAAAAAPLMAGRAWMKGVTFCLILTTLSFSRPEAPLVAFSIGTYWLWRLRSRWILAAGLAVGFLLIVGLAARYNYYGELLPNTYYAKPSSVMRALNCDDVNGALNGAARTLSGNVLRPLASFGGVGILFLALIPVISKGSQATAGALVAAMIAGFIFLITAPHDWMTGHRFAFPFLPAALVLAGIGLNTLVALIAHQHERIVKAASIAVILGALTNIAVSWRGLRDYRSGEVNAALSAAPFVRIGEMLRHDASPDDTVLAYEVGAVGYISKLAIIDHEGLVNHRVARIITSSPGGYDSLRRGLDEKGLQELLDYCDSCMPDWFLVRASGKAPLQPGARVPETYPNERIQQALLERLSSSMRLHASVSLENSGFDKYLLLRRCSNDDCQPVSD